MDRALFRASSCAVTSCCSWAVGSASRLELSRGAAFTTSCCRRASRLAKYCELPLSLRSMFSFTILLCTTCTNMHCHQNCSNCEDPTQLCCFWTFHACNRDQTPILTGPCFPSAEGPSEIEKLHMQEFLEEKKNRNFHKIKPARCTQEEGLVGS